MLYEHKSVLPDEKFAQLRQDYVQATLDEGNVAASPFQQFHAWYDQALAAGLSEPNAMHLATCSSEGRPSGRMVLLKDLDDRGFTFFTNYESRKADHIGHTPHVALTFFWQPLERQVRIEGMVEKINPEASDLYFATRPLGSKIGAWASPQSQMVPSRATLEARFDEAKTRFVEGAVPRPEHWGGYRVIPVMVEFWQGRRSRLHDRVVYELQDDGNWKIFRLAP